MDTALVFRRSAALFNRAVIPLLGTAPGRRLLAGSFAVLTYTGRKSSREITVPVGYRRDGEDLVVAVLVPDAKTWWRNFTGSGDRVTVTMGNTVVVGQGVATRSDRGGVSVRITPD